MSLSCEETMALNETRFSVKRMRRWVRMSGSRLGHADVGETDELGHGELPRLHIHFNHRPAGAHAPEGRRIGRLAGLGIVFSSSGMKLPVPMILPASMPYFLRRSSTNGKFEPGRRPRSRANSSILLRASSAVMRTAVPIW